MSYQDILKAQLVIDEGRTGKLYKDSRGSWTIGIGYNLSANPVSDAVIDQLYADAIFPIDGQCRALFPTFDSLTDARKAVIANMMYNMGPTVFAQFKQFIALVTSCQYGAAADDMLTTAWASQVGQRAVRLAQAMRDG